MLTKVLIFTKVYESTKKNLSKIILRKLTKDKVQVRKKKIHKESNHFKKHLGIDDRMDIYSDQHPFITLKDHKDNFKNNP